MTRDTNNVMLKTNIAPHPKTVNRKRELLYPLQKPLCRLALKVLKNQMHSVSSS